MTTGWWRSAAQLDSRAAHRPVLMRTGRNMGLLGSEAGLEEGSGFPSVRQEQGTL